MFSVPGWNAEPDGPPVCGRSLECLQNFGDLGAKRSCCTVTHFRSVVWAEPRVYCVSSTFLDLPVEWSPLHCVLFIYLFIQRSLLEHRHVGHGRETRSSVAVPHAESRHSEDV